MAPLLVLLCLFAARPAPVPLKLTHPVLDKNFYLLSLLRQHAKELSSSSLTAMAQRHRSALHTATAICGTEPTCYVEKLKLTDSDIAAVETELRKLPNANKLGRDLAASGVRIREAGQTGPDLLVSTWRSEAAALNRVIDIYGLGTPPHYAEVDSAMNDPKSPAFARTVQISAAVLDDTLEGTPAFFETTLRFADELLMLNHRDEAGRFEPMEQGENRAAFARIRSVKFAAYPYSAIVVPGSGTDKITVAFSPNGRARVELAAKRFREGKAPFILVSGGFVHPNQTPHCEAVEMKKSLMYEFGVPENAILIDPHARHTTTNLRNAARLIYRYGMPFEKKVLVTTDMLQSAYIDSAVFRERCRKEIGYLPMQMSGRLTRFDLEFLPLLDSLEEDPTEPLDP